MRHFLRRAARALVRPLAVSHPGLRHAVGARVGLLAGHRLYYRHVGGCDLCSYFTGGQQHAHVLEGGAVLAVVGEGAAGVRVLARGPAHDNHHLVPRFQTSL